MNKRLILAGILAFAWSAIASAGPIAAVAGSLIGGLIGGGGTMAGLASVGGIVGSMVGSTIVGSLMKPKSQSYPSVGAPATPAPAAMPGSQAPNPNAPNGVTPGDTAAATNADIAKGQMDSIKRRGRMSTILSGRQVAGDEEIERLG